MRRHGIAGLLVLASSVAIAGPDPVNVSSPYPIHREYGNGDHYMGVRLEGVLKLQPVQVNGHTLGGLSALGWDSDEQVLYAVSDRGVIFHLLLRDDDDGYLAEVRVAAAHALADGRGRVLTGRSADSEGLALRNADNGQHGDSELVICFERRPRVLRFSPRGELLGSVALPARLRDEQLYRHGNRSLESLTWHDQHGFLTAPEQPFATAPAGELELHALGSGRHWRYPLADEPNAGLTDAVAMPDASVLTLERGYGVFFVPITISIRRIAALPAEDGAMLSVQTLARFNSGQGWALDNFEGLTHQGGKRILTVSDDNGRALQSTLLMALRLLDTDASQIRSSNLKSVNDPRPTDRLQ